MGKKVDDNKKEIDELHEHDVKALEVIAQKIEDLARKREELEKKVEGCEKTVDYNSGLVERHQKALEDLGWRQNKDEEQDDSQEKKLKLLADRLEALEKKVDTNVNKTDESQEQQLKRLKDRLEGLEKKVD